MIIKSDYEVSQEESMTHRKRKNSPDANGDSDDSSQDGESLVMRQRMLEALEKQTMAQFEIKSIADSDPDEADSISEEYEEWCGISDWAQSDEDSNQLINNGCSQGHTDDEFDDDEDLFQSALLKPIESNQVNKKPEVLVFNDPSRIDTSVTIDWETRKAERKNFMASMLQKQIGSTALNLNPTQKAGNKEEDEEAHLKALDRSLVNLISHLSAPQSKASNLDAILSSALPPPTKSNNPQRHPRAMKAGMARASLERSLAADRQAALSGTVRSREEKTITKRQKRAQDGTADRERRERRGRVDGVIGSSGGGMVKLSEREIKQGMRGMKIGGRGRSGKGQR